MPETKKSFAKKSALIFVGIMLFFTFASKTIHYYMMPKVTASRVESGYIKYNIPIGDVDFYSENEVEVKIPEKLKKPFIIGNIPVEEGSTVKKGEILVTFENRSYNELLSEYEKEISRLKLELMEFDKNFSVKIKQLEKDILDLNNQIEKYSEYIAVSCINTDELINKMEEIRKLELQYKQKSEEIDKNKKLYEAEVITYQDIERTEKELKSLEEQIKSEYSRYDRLQCKLLEDYKENVKEAEYKVNQLSEELEYIEDSGILNGRSRPLIERELDEKNQSLEFITKYPELRSPIDGVVEKIFYKKMDSYEGVNTIILLKQGEDFKKLIVSLTGKYESEDYNDMFKGNMPCVLKYGKYTIDGKIAGDISKDSKKYLLIDIGIDEGTDIRISKGTSTNSSTDTGTSKSASTGTADTDKGAVTDTAKGAGTDKGAGIDTAKGSGTNTGTGESKELKIDIKLPEENDSVTMEIKGEYCNILVPNSAFITSDELFVMKTRKGFWGEEYYVVKQKVQTGEGNEYFTQVTSGLVRNDMIITSWDRELNDGATVTLPLK